MNIKTAGFNIKQLEVFGEEFEAKGTKWRMKNFSENDHLRIQWAVWKLESHEEEVAQLHLRLKSAEEESKVALSTARSIIDHLLDEIL